MVSGLQPRVPPRELSWLPVSAGFLLDIYFYPEDGSSVSVERLLFTELYGVPIQKFADMPNTTAKRGKTPDIYSVGGHFEFRTGQ